MSNHLPARKHSMLKRLRSTRVRALLSIGIVLGFGAVGTLAYWTNSATLTGGTFTAGNLDIKLGSPAPGFDDNPSEFSTGATSFAMTNMQPGSSKAATVLVRNSGSLDFTYTATGITAGGTLASLLEFKVVPSGVINAGATDCTGTSSYNATMAVSPVLPALPSNVITANRPLASGASEAFCVVATLPTGTTTGQLSSATATFTFNAKQP